MKKHIVNIPVVCIGKQCRNCPEMAIDITTTLIFDPTKDKYTTELVKMSCKHVDRCMHIMENAVEEMKNQENDTYIPANPFKEDPQ